MNFLKTESKKQIKKNLNIQMENNNRILRENFRKEQILNKALNAENAVLKEQIQKLKNNIRTLQKDNETLAKMINELAIKYNIKFETGKKPATKTAKNSKKKGE